MKVYIVHGYSATSTDHWFPWLADELQARGHEATVLDLPDSTSPDAAAWESTLSDMVGSVDQETILVTHSLGTITALRWLANQPGAWRLGALVAVAGFQDALASLPDLDGYLAEHLDVSRVRGHIGKVVSIASDNDPFVPPVQTRALARELGAHEVIVPGAGHFLADEGQTTLPAALHAVLQNR